MRLHGCFFMYLSSSPCCRTCKMCPHAHFLCSVASHVELPPHPSLQPPNPSKLSSAPQPSPLMPIAKMHPFGHAFGVSVLLGPAPLPSITKTALVHVFWCLVPWYPPLSLNMKTHRVFSCSAATPPPHHPTLQPPQHHKRAQNSAFIVFNYFLPPVFSLVRLCIATSGF